MIFRQVFKRFSLPPRPRGLNDFPMEQLSELWKSFKKYDEENRDGRIKGFLEESFVITTAILIMYCLLTCVVIPKIMANRRPFSLSLAVASFNIFQIIASGVGSLLLLSQLMKDETSMLFCKPVDKTPSGDFTASILHGLFYMRLIDLIETFFYALKKKDRQVSYLHVTHHIGNVWAIFLCNRYSPGGSVMAMYSLNFMIHAIMYTYYLMSSHGTTGLKQFAAKNKHILTGIQIVQLVFILHLLVDDFLSPRCGAPSISTVPTFLHIAHVLALFIHFYVKNYVNSKPKTI